MSGTFSFKGDTLVHKPEDPGYRVGWKYKYQFEKGHLDEEMTYGEALQKCAELAAKEPEKTFWPELVLTPNF